MTPSTSPSTEIRPLVLADEGAWRELWTDYLAFYDTTVPESVYRDTFNRLCSAAEPDLGGFLACRDGRPVGLVHYLFHAHFWKPEGVCYLQDLFVTPGARGQGIAGALIEAVYDAADAAGRPSVYWTTQEFNHRARRLYDRVGICTPFIKYTRP
ncbi:GNAT family N-acetyltransferase [Alkalilacustris brevis]|uniref:GNAT family N-acetyltransferase n=1 Tax=Alkalilacustris brevis TaxID=2026338 RepID=UPI000E0E062A|nr:GNAT family N-acetyltransferase [Alkalilacustris brevis]